MSEQLPKHVDGRRLARQESRIAGTIPVARLERLASFLCGGRGEVDAELQFGVDGGVPFVRGSAHTDLELVCQRCLELMVQRVQTEFCLGMVSSESLIARLPEIYEPLVIGEEPLRTWDLVEDELILALPIVPRHDPAQCAARVPQEATPRAQERQESPFAALIELKNKGTSD